MKSGRGIELSQGELITLAASAARTVSASGTGVFIGGERKRFIIVNAITASATAAGDTLDAYVDWSLDDVTYYNACHFTQQAGNGAARTEFAVLDAAAPGTAVVNVTSDAAAAAVRPTLFGAYLRARWVLVDGGGGDTSHTFSVLAYAI
jgi:hypothetical protein